MTLAHGPDDGPLPALPLGLTVLTGVRPATAERNGATPMLGAVRLWW